MTDLSRRHRIHVVGAAGAGMSAIATVLAAMGHDVSGSDIKSSPALDRLASAGVAVSIGHDAAAVDGVDLVAVSSAIPPDNIEVEAAEAAGVPVASRAEVLADITALRRTVAVAGTHGKTTTSSMLALILVEAGLRPSFIIGGDVNDIGTNAVWDDGEWLVVEADESDGTFLRLEREIALVTSLEADHLEHYGGFPALEASFARFVEGARIALVLADGAACEALLRHAPPGSSAFGTAAGSRFRARGIEPSRGEVSFSLGDGDEDLGRYSLPMPGEYNALNATAAVAASLLVGVSAEDGRRALARFAGLPRRYEFRGERNGVTFVDDYAHNPGKVRAALKAARAGGFARIVAVFQPHRYSRTQSLAPQYADAFVDADVTVVTSIYPAGEPVRPGVSGQNVVDAVREAHREADITFVPDHEGLLALLRQVLRPGDLCILLEAGDLAGLPDELLADERW